MDIQNTVHVNSAFTYAQKKAISYRHEFITPEHLLSAFLEQSPFASALNMCFCDTQELAFSLENYFTEELESVPADMDYELEVSTQLNELIQHAYLMIDYSSAEALNVPHLVQSMLQLKESWACHILKEALEEDLPEFISQLISRYEEVEVEDDLQTSPQEKSEPWRNFVTCLNDCLQDHNPLIGREAELERTIQVLCRKEKNNPLHVGEPGVGKTSLAYGLAARIEAREVPERLLDCRIYELDLGTLLAGTQYRGDFEKRLKTIMEGVRNEGRAIIYIDEIHNLIGAGRTGDGSMDASNMLKPYLESGDIRFIGSTTYEEYNRYFARSKGLVRRFQQIDILEPSIEETIHIVEGLKEKYEEFHGVTYQPDVIPYAVKASVRYISDRFLPDKAIDLVDEAGAYREIHPIPSGEQIVDKTLITDVLARICKVDALAMKEEDTTSLETLHARISAKIYGQEEAVRQVVEAVQMSKAGLLDENKPLASLLFVGPTGVGKTEVAKVLASELGISLQRFDMSEYTEKHTVAKLIGSPAGYVGYEDGGLLTDAIRKTPNCVLLLDEIEKAHPDVFNILLQVMDYAVLTDNKGRKADCRHVVLIMTSNAGAQFARQASIGFSSQITAGEAMLKQVKKTFKPEFINRLSATVVFHDMSREMASLILDKKLGELSSKLAARQIEMELSPEARNWLLQRGFLPEYGAREMNRVIASHLKPLLMREILFGSLKSGGKTCIQVDKDQLVLQLSTK
ncbi:AAA family ATPase [Bacteroides cellulosilyticus]|jgi:ATP-dependent Clp protease ATP-binding subunit ClpA|uniref:AAA domain-containing protein n=2 Tax=Bacteroides cellulosilyticus TaxID=246787 RepID=A0A108TEN6_9BACE|nr:AAA family ATPase [Bacteroides cellulosilyticus]EIY24284.1 ATP-dependent Clp protease ATP-binding subunit ClpA [Bacteroides cellulosilyticus CL02T12C19]KAA5423721.1 AAA domain-containing protein [Bacteroides cellulosilyticus]KWR58540.1 putative ATP-dependent Clp protease ATP-binding subunit, ClpA-like [Bacteroides cellulosilyticus]MBX9087339.1 AAA domain-containing protein [Bacteroides cellulosilyticus]QUT89883.1 Bacteriodales T6SS TssH (ClpV) protein [Bacteroides cellulosilyticus]